jgi:hypothetical protein
MVRKATKSQQRSHPATPAKGRATSRARSTAAVPVQPVARIPRQGFLSGRRAAPLAEVGALPVPLTAAQVQAAHAAHVAAIAASVQLPTLHERTTDGRTVGPHTMGDIAGFPASGKRKKKKTQPGAATARVVAVIARAGWRRRWELTPLGAGAAVAGWAATDPGAAALACAALGGCSHAAARYLPERVGGRVWLSGKERTIITSWAAGASVWAAAAGAGLLHPNAVGVLALGALTGAQSLAWVKSRHVRPTVGGAEPGMSEQAAALIAAWPWTVALKAPDPLLGSVIDPVTMTEPAAGAYAFQVELRCDVHAEQATTVEIRRYLERALRLPVGTVQTQIDRDDSARLSVTMTPGRHLETADATWPGPVLTVDGLVPVALTPAGTQVAIELHNTSGIRHLTLIGSSGAGKSVASAALLLPGPLAGREVVLFIDGKRGTSAPGTAGALDMAALDPAAWSAGVRIAHRVMVARQARYGAAGIDRFDAATSTDPILTLWIDEATGVRKSLPDDLVSMVVDILREGRALGVRCVQCVQRPQFDSYIGGITARELMMGTAGATVALKPGGEAAADLTVGATSETINLAALPDGGGWCAILQSSRVLAPKARIYHAGTEAINAALAGFTPRSLTGLDLIAAGAEYRDRMTGAQWIGRMATARAQLAAGIDPTAPTRPVTGPAPAAVLAIGSTDPIQDVPADRGPVTDLAPDRVGADHPELATVATASQKAAAATARFNRATVLTALVQTPTGMTRNDIVTVTGLTKSTVRRALMALAADGGAAVIGGTEPEQWRPLAAEQLAAA